MNAAVGAAAAEAAERAPRLAFALLVALVLALQFSPALGLVGYRLGGQAGWAFVGLSRDLLVAALVAVALPALLRPASPSPALLRPASSSSALPSSARWALATAAVFVALAALSDAPREALALNLRRLLLMPLLFAAVTALPWSGAQVRLALRLLLATSVAVALFGIAERLAPEALWTEVLRVVDYAAANPLDPFGALPFHDSGRFFSWDFERWTGGEPLRRAVSTYLEPTTLAAAMAAALVLALALRRRTAIVLAIAACGALTLSKSFLLWLPLLAAWRAFGTPSPRHVLRWSALAAALALGADALGRLDGPLEHLGGLASALRYLAEGHLLGEGVGLAGNYAGEDFDVGAESGLGNVIAQVGIAALLPLLWLRALGRDVLAAARERADDGGRWVAGWLLFWLVSFLFSASSLGVGGNALGFLLLGLYLHPAWPAGPVDPRCASPS